MGNLAAALHGPVTKRGCRIGLGDQRVRSEDGRYSYPDIVFVCDSPEYTDDVPPILPNPLLLIEIASPSTAGRDRGRKLAAYTRLPSLAEYWMVEPDRPEVTCVIRQPGGWGLRFALGLNASIGSAALDVVVPLTDVYPLVDLDV